jgi:hypothetical protein
VGSWPYYRDYSDKCTSFIGDVLSYHIVQMYQDGTYDGE